MNRSLFHHLRWLKHLLPALLLISTTSATRAAMPTPTIKVMPGESVSEVIFVLSTYVDNAEFYYTTDGSEPSSDTVNTTSQLCTGRIALSQNTIIKAIAVHERGYEDDSAVLEVGVLAAWPELTFAAPSGGGTIYAPGEEVAVALNAPAGVEIRYVSGNSDEVESTSPLLPSPFTVNGSINISARAYDPAGIYTVAPEVCYLHIHGEQPKSWWKASDAGVTQDTYSWTGVLTDENGNTLSSSSGTFRFWITDYSRMTSRPLFRFGSYASASNDFSQFSAAEVFFAHVPYLPDFKNFTQDESDSSEGYGDGEMSDSFFSTIRHVFEFPESFSYDQPHVYHTSSSDTRWSASLNGQILYETVTNVAFTNAIDGRFDSDGIGEVLLFDRELAADERQAAVDYLLSKYRINVAPGDGLMAEYTNYTDANDPFNGTTYKQLDARPQVNLPAELESTNVAIRWTGTLVSDVSGPVMLHYDYSWCGVVVKLDGNIVDRDNLPELVAGQSYLLSIECLGTGDRVPYFELYWKKGWDYRVPTANLFSGTNRAGFYNTPKYKLEPGSLPNTVYVNFEGDEQTTIHYTTDGSTPTEASPIYTEPMEFSSDTWVKAIAAGPSKGTSGVRSLRVLTQKPVLHYNPPANGTVYQEGEEVTVTVDYSHPTAQVYYSRDLSEFPSHKDQLLPGEFTIVDSTTLTIYARDTSRPDAHGNPVTYRFQYDNATMTPELMGSIIAHFDASKTDSVTEDVNGVSQWSSSNDLSLHMSRNPNASTAIYGHDNMSDLRFITFHNGWYDLNQNIYDGHNALDGSDMFICLRYRAGAHSGGIPVGLDNQSSRWWRYIYSGETDEWFGSDTLYTFPNYLATGAIFYKNLSPLQDFHIYNVSAGDGSRGDPWSASFNGETLHETFDNTVDFGNGMLQFGGLYADFAEVLIFDKKLDEGSRKQVEAFLRYKHGLRIAIVPSPPTSVEGIRLSDTQTLITWQGSSDDFIGTYDIKRIDDSGNIVIESAGSMKSWIDAESHPTQVYTYYVRSRGIHGLASGWSEPISVPVTTSIAGSIPLEDIYVWLGAETLPSGIVNLWRSQGKVSLSLRRSDIRGNEAQNTYDAYNGWPAIRLYSGTQFMLSDNVFSELPSGSDIFYVLRYKGYSNDLTNGLINTGTGSPQDYSYPTGSNIIEKFGSTGDATLSFPAPYSVIDSLHIYNVSAGDDWSAYINGLRYAYKSGHTVGWGEGMAYLGSARLSSWNNDCFNGDIAEILIFDKQLNVTERMAVEQYLSKKYALGLPEIAPPLITPFSGDHWPSLDVAIDCEDPEAKIYYTFSTDRGQDAGTPTSSDFCYTDGDREGLLVQSGSTNSHLQIKVVAIRVIDGVEKRSHELEYTYNIIKPAGSGVGLVPVYQGVNALDSEQVVAEEFAGGAFAQDENFLPFMNNGSQVMGTPDALNISVLNMLTNFNDQLPSNVSMNTSNFTVVWEGELEVRYNHGAQEPLTLIYESDEVAKLCLDTDRDGIFEPESDLYISGSGRQTVAWTGTLSPDVRYPIRIVYEESSDRSNVSGGDMVLKWSSPSLGEEVIPKTQLYPLGSESAGTQLPLNIEWDPLISTSNYGTAVSIGGTGQTISFTSDAGAKIAYTTDGSEPTQNSGLLPMGNSLTFNTDTVLRVRAFDPSNTKAPSLIYNVLLVVDEEPPELSALGFADSSAGVVSKVATSFSATADDQGSQVRAVRFYLESLNAQDEVTASQLLSEKTSGSSEDVYTLAFDSLAHADGRYQMRVEAEDQLGIVGTATLEFTLDLEAPAAPALGGATPGNDKSYGTSQVTIAGTARRDSTVSINHKAPGATEWSLLQSGIPVSSGGSFSWTGTFDDTTAETSHEICAFATGRNDKVSALSAVRSFKVDTAFPPPPTNLQVTKQAGGKLRLTWDAPAYNNIIDAYFIERSINGSDWLHVATVSASTRSYTDTPGGTLGVSYRILTRNKAGTFTKTDALSGTNAVVPDASLPTFTITYEAGAGTNWHEVEGSLWYAPGFIDITVGVDEPLQGTPTLYFNRPGGGIPVTVTLYGSGGTYEGSLAMGKNLPTGTYTAVLTGYDLAGNRGGADLVSTFNFDSQGPALSDPSQVPLVYANTESGQSCTLELVLDEPYVVPDPDDANILNVSASWSQEGNASLANLMLNVVDADSMNVTFDLPGEVGFDYAAADYDESDYEQELSENLLVITLTLTDALGNTDVRTLPAILVYKNLPRLPPPDVDYTITGLREVTFTWPAVLDAEGEAAYYRVYRDADKNGTYDAGELEETIVAGTGSYSYKYEADADGEYDFAFFAFQDDDGDPETTEEGYGAEIRNVDIVPPPVPTNLQVQEHASNPNVLEITWDAPTPDPLSTDRFTLYRWKNQEPSLETLTDPGVKKLGSLTGSQMQSQLYDSSPIPETVRYALVGEDIAGNKVLSSATPEITRGLVPPPTITVTLEPDQAPLLEWEPVQIDALNYNFYRNSATTPFHTIEDESIASYVDVGWTGEATTYWIEAEIGSEAKKRDIAVPVIEAVLADDSSVARGIPAKLEFVFSSPVDLTAYSYVLSVNTGTGWTQGSLNQPYVNFSTTEVGEEVTLQTKLVLTPTAYVDYGERVIYQRSYTLPVVERQPTLELQAAELGRGTAVGDGDIQLIIANDSENSIRVKGSKDVSLRLLDASGSFLAQANASSAQNVLASSTLPGIVDKFSFTVPADAPSLVVLEARVENYFYMDGSGQEIELNFPLQTRLSVSTVPVSYNAVLDSAGSETELKSSDDTYVITGQALSTQQGMETVALSAVPVTMTLRNGNYRRTLTLVTDASGNFRYEFDPSADIPAGEYEIAVKHPDLVQVHDPLEAEQTIKLHRLSYSPIGARVRIPLNYEQKVPVKVSWSSISTVSQVRMEIPALPDNITVRCEAVEPAIDATSVELPVYISADLGYDLTNEEVSFNLEVRATLGGQEMVLGTFPVDLSLLPPSASLSGSSKKVLLGVFKDGTDVHQDQAEIRFSNSGLLPVTGVNVKLYNKDGSPAPSWMRISQGKNTLEIDEEATWLLETFAPTDTMLGTYNLVAVATCNEGVSTGIDIDVEFTESSNSTLTIHVVNAYYGIQNDDSGVVVDEELKNKYQYGVGGAKVRLLRNDLSQSAGGTWTPPAEITSTTQTNSDPELHGRVTFGDNETLPAGRYRLIIDAPGHDRYDGVVEVKPGVTHAEIIPVEYGAVTVEWEVKEITIEDRYEIKIETIFETKVPAPTIVVTPPAFSIPPMCPGDVHDVELTIENKGLVTARGIANPLPTSTEYFEVIDISKLPSTLDIPAQQRVQVSFRLKCIKATPDAVCDNQ